MKESAAVKADEFVGQNVEGVIIDGLRRIFDNDRRFDLVFKNVFTYIVELANSLADDFDIYIAFGIRDQTPMNFKDYFDPRVNLIYVKNFTRAINFNKDVQAYFEIRKIAKEIKPDIVHLSPVDQVDFHAGDAADAVAHRVP